MDDENKILSVKVNHVLGKYVFRTILNKVNKNYFLQFKDVKSYKWYFVNYDFFTHNFNLSENERTSFKSLIEIERVIFNINNKIENNFEFEYYYF